MCLLTLLPAAVPDVSAAPPSAAAASSTCASEDDDEWRHQLVAHHDDSLLNLCSVVIVPFIGSMTTRSVTGDLLISSMCWLNVLKVFVEVE